MYIGHGRLCVCLSVCLSVPHCIPTLLHGPRCKLGNDRGCPLVVHYWVDLQSVHWFRCYDNIALNEKCQRVLVLALCLVIMLTNILVSILILILIFVDILRYWNSVANTIEENCSVISTIRMR